MSAKERLHRGHRDFVHLSRRETMKRHAIKRFYQRRGIVLAAPDYEALVEQIARGEIYPCATTNIGAGVFKVTHREVEAYAIWNVEERAIVTFYPYLHWVTQNGGKLLERTPA